MHNCDPAERVPAHQNLLYSRYPPGLFSTPSRAIGADKFGSGKGIPNSVERRHDAIYVAVHLARLLIKHKSPGIAARAVSYLLI